MLVADLKAAAETEEADKAATAEQDSAAAARLQCDLMAIQVAKIQAAITKGEEGGADDVHGTKKEKASKTVEQVKMAKIQAAAITLVAAKAAQVTETSDNEVEKEEVEEEGEEAEAEAEEGAEEKEVERVPGEENDEAADSVIRTNAANARLKVAMVESILLLHHTKADEEARTRQDAEEAAAARTVEGEHNVIHGAAATAEARVDAKVVVAVKDHAPIDAAPRPPPPPPSSWWAAKFNEAAAEVVCGFIKGKGGNAEAEFVRKHLQKLGVALGHLASTVTNSMTMIVAAAVLMM